MADIVPFLKGQSFDAETLRIMGAAYDTATRELHDAGQPFVVKEVLAGRIIYLAQTGERDPARLSRRALEELGIQRTD